MNIEDIMKMWAKDSRIDEINLDKECSNIPKLHAKYLELLTVSKLRLKRKELSQKQLLKDKWLYYTGKMDKQDMDDRGWPYDPFNGLKVMKSDLSYYYNSDKDLQKSEELIGYNKVLVETLSEILGHINWRSNLIKNMIQWRTFTSGG